MRIEELIIDGFKSYPVRTHVSGFDPSFNAITGLNGSGKSNILDSICFVLGITNLSAVRASNLQDLIYKRGQAGVTKASVTIVFDNSDRARSPVGFEGSTQITVTRQIAMGGLSKYIVNGHKSTQAKVQTIFQSVQLNINNPNFLIMQGKITKVLNMKAPEILSMIEEAAGTRMFEDRKEKAIKTITKKDQKVQEITAILAEEITPKLDKLREEKRSFLEYQKASSELERLTRLAKAYEWQSVKARAEKQTVLLEAKRNEVLDKDASIKALHKHIQSIEKELEGIEKRREKDLLKGGKLQGLITRAKELEHGLVKAKTLVDFKLAGIEEENKKIQTDTGLLHSLEEARDNKSAALEQLSASFATLKDAYDSSVADLQKNEELLQTLLTGVVCKKADSVKGTNQGGYMGQLADARASEASAGTEIEQAKMRIGHLEKELRGKEPAAKKAEKENSGLLKEMQISRQAVESLSAKLSSLDWDEEKESNLLRVRGDLGRQISDLLEKRNSLKSRLAGMDFSYNDPEPGFDRSKIKGLVASLIELNPDRHKYSTALEICAGGRLYNVVVEDAETGTKLLSKGGLRKRVTLIPLNKINAFVTSAEKLGAAQRIAPGKVDLALNLVGYEQDVMKAMQYVFGNTLICADAESAKRVTFDAKVRVKSVTLDGDVYDPSGTLSGGSKPSSGGVLVKLQGLHQVEKELQAARAQLKTCEDELAASKAQIDSFKRLKRDFELKKHEAALMQAQIDGSNATRIVGEVEACKTTIASLKSTIADAHSRSEAARTEASRLEKEMEEFNANKDSKLEELKAALKAKKAEVQKQNLTITSHQHDKRTLQLELEEAHLDVKKAVKDLEECKAARDKAQQEAKEMQAEADRIQNEVDETSANLESERATLSSYDAELNTLREAVKSKRQQIADEELVIKQLTHEIEKGAQESASADKSLHSLETDFEWIKEESKFFGQADTAYDFSKHNMGEIRKTCRRLEEQQQGMKKKVNPKVLNMIDSVEKKETSLNQMLSTVLKDKNMIEDTISELDRYKKDALQTTWEKVNGDFGDIFAELLPGNYAKLQPPEGQELTQGLEVKVRLGEVWKQSLTELSGGQRSLIALSLIMSLLQFKPAPMYILDEIDAALDLSHTQHIGQLFKSRFSGSQFIVVSLKEGLFTNANVLFRARFRDGTSIVERTAQRGSTQTIAANESHAGGKENAPTRKRAAAQSKTATTASQRPARTALGAA